MERLRLWLLQLAFCCALLAVGALDSLQLEPDLEGYQLVLRRTANRGDKLQIFQSIWGAIRADFANDADKTKGLYSQLSNFIQSDQQCTSGSTGRAACELQQEVRRHLRQLLAQRLANMLNAQDNIEAYGMYIATSVEPALVRDILVHAIRDVYFYRTPENLAHQLYELYADKDEVSFKMMIEAQLALYAHFRAMNDWNDAYLFNVAYIVSQIQTHHLYANVDKALEQRLSALQRSLPAVLKNLFNTQGFCLLNRANWEMLYTTISDDWNYGVNGRQVFTWHEANYTDSSGLLRAFMQEQLNAATSAHSTPVFTLRGELNKWYYFVDSTQRNRLAALRSGSPSSSTSVWSIKYVDDSLVFRQRDLTLCAAEMYDKERRLVTMVPGQLHMPPSDVCLWIPTQCVPQR